MELREEVVHVGDDGDALDTGQDREFEAELFDLVVDEVERGDVWERDIGAEDGNVEDEVGEGGERRGGQAGRAGVAEREAAEARGAADGEVARAGKERVGVSRRTSDPDLSRLCSGTKLDSFVAHLQCQSYEPLQYQYFAAQLAVWPRQSLLKRGPVLVDLINSAKEVPPARSQRARRVQMKLEGMQEV